MASNKNSQSPLWPGVIALKPYSQMFEALYHGEAQEFFTYREAEAWIIQKQEEEQNAM